jgi:periplasmic protein TonB
MLHELLESKPKRQRGGWGTAVSLTLHAGAIAAAVVATMQTVYAKGPPDAPPEVIYRPRMPDPAPRPERTAAGPASPGPVVPTLPRLPDMTVSEIPVGIPPVGEAISDEAIRALNQGFRGGSPIGDVAGTGVAAVASDGVYDVHMVDRAVVSVANNPSPRYPEMLRDAGVEGQVLAQFVVDTLGRVDMRSFRVLAADHDLFADAVRLTVPRMRFLPAEVGVQSGRPRKVPQLVQMPFSFSIQPR